MARLEVNGFGSLQESFAELERMPTSVLDEMLNAGADVVVKAQKKTASTMLQGKYYRGDIMRAIKKTRPKSSKDGRIISVYPQGKNRDGNPNAEVAFVNEYGAPRKNIKARPFIATANKQAENEAVAAEEKVYDEFLKSKNL